MIENRVKENGHIWWQDLKPNILWYLVGLIASDGCLSTDGRHIDITAKEFSYLELIKQCCKIPNKVGKKRNGKGEFVYRIQLSSRSFYCFLTDLGLMPNKSKRLGELNIPKEFFHDFLRGVIDGDGGIRSWQHPKNGVEQWSLRIVSASKPFAEWLKKCCEDYFSVYGRIHGGVSEKSQLWVLKYGKLAAQVLLSRCYYDDKALCLKRKAVMAKRCCAAERGWSTSKTIMKARVAELADARDSINGSALR
ncbi:MAG: hypothetical protein ABH871_03090 [Pseudomonadota bacterium]